MGLLQLLQSFRQPLNASRLPRLKAAPASLSVGPEADRGEKDSLSAEKEPPCEQRVYKKGHEGAELSG